MIDPLAAHLALRARVLNLVICTTGTMTLAATATGYSRATGSFLADGFKAGMQITPSGFGANTVDTLLDVTASDLTTTNARAVETAAGSRSISVGLPADKAWELNRYTPSPGIPYIKDSFIPGSQAMITAPFNGGQSEETGLYVLQLYGPSGVGMAALRAMGASLLARYTPGTVCGPVIVDGQPGPTASQILPVDGELAVITLRVPWFARSTNTIAA